jgi:uncharacterized protein YndB with AHSA1/START domain
MHGCGRAVITLPRDDQILITREFAVPRHLVFRAWTTPELVKRWWGGHRGEVTTVEIDFRIGDRWRYVMLVPRGIEVAFHGEYIDIVPNARIVATEVFEGQPGGAALTTTTFTELRGRTVLQLLVQHANKEARDAHLNSGMEVGMQEGMNLLEQLARALPEAAPDR